MKTIQMTIDARLLSAVDKLTRTRKTTRSALIRNALESELKRARMLDLEAQHVAGYRRLPVKSGEFDVWSDEQDWGKA